MQWFNVDFFFKHLVIFEFFFSLSTKDDCFNVSIQPPVGELLLPVAMSEKDFKKERGER